MSFSNISEFLALNTQNQAWPTIIDDFVAWKKERSGDKPPASTADEA
jgi:hypothetical protein